MIPVDLKSFEIGKCLKVKISYSSIYPDMLSLILLISRTGLSNFDLVKTSHHNVDVT